MQRYYQRVTARLVRERAEEPFGPTMDGSRECAKFLGGLIADKPVEHMVVLALNARHRLVGYKVVAVGGATSCAVEPREVFAVAFQTGAVALVCGHNHPSGDPQPSADDVVLTRRLEQAGKMLGIPILDHVVVGFGGAFSFAEHGLIGKAA